MAVTGCDKGRKEKYASQIKLSIAVLTDIDLILQILRIHQDPDIYR
jgi:hypothetical protein